jgi:hypothetical protein
MRIFEHQEDNQKTFEHLKKEKKMVASSRHAFHS